MFSVLASRGLAGFLPVNNPDIHNGEGFVTYLIRQKTNLPSGSEITNQADIVFDVNDPILTNVALNTIDADPPNSSVDALPATTTTLDFTVSWSGDDPNGSGIASYDVYVSDNGGPFVAWQSGITETQAIFSGAADHTYGFYSVAIDHVGYRQPVPAGPQATTTVIPGPEDNLLYLPLVVR